MVRVGVGGWSLGGPRAPTPVKSADLCHMALEACNPTSVDFSIWTWNVCTGKTHLGPLAHIFNTHFLPILYSV